MKIIKIAVIAVSFYLTGCAGVGGFFQANQYIVQTGDTLDTVAFRYQLEAADLSKWNRFSSSRVLKPGETIYVRDPNEDPRVAPRPSVAKKESYKAVAVKPVAKPAKPKKNNVTTVKPGYFKNNYNWPWPTIGKVVKDSSVKKYT